MAVYRTYGRGDLSLGGMFTKPADLPMPPNWLYYIRVPNVDEAAERVKALGGQVLNGPMDVPGSDRIAQCLDPQGRGSRCTRVQTEERRIGGSSRETGAAGAAPVM